MVFWGVSIWLFVVAVAATFCCGWFVGVCLFGVVEFSWVTFDKVLAGFVVLVLLSTVVVVVIIIIPELAMFLDRN